MSYQYPFVGYGGRVWGTAYQTAAYLNSLLQSGSVSPAAVASPALASFATMANGADAVSAWQTAGAMALEVMNMAAIQALPLTLDPTTLAYFDARVAAVAAAASGLALLPPPANPFAATGLIAAGQPAIASPLLVEWCAGFAAETPPSGLTSPAALVTYASGEAAAWYAVADAIRVLQGNALTAAYDTAARQYRVAAAVASGLAQVAAAAGGYAQRNVVALWNQAVTVPSLLLDAASLVSSPASLANQQGVAIRFSLRGLAATVARLLLSLRSPITSNVVTATLRRNETLMDLAARAAGGYEEWSAIAALNQVGPPWPGPTEQVLAASGTPLLLPGSSLPVSGQPAPTYAANVLGIDYDFGPINGPQPAWLGDVSLIVGYANLRRALGRRLQTPLGTLIYHPTYGSRIPPEVGAVQGGDEALRLAAFGKAALAADPRVASVVSAAASVQPPFAASFSGVVIPVGPGATPVGVSEVISPLP